MNIGSNISKAIKEGKWLNVSYKNENETTYFWAAIKDINIEKKTFCILLFNDKKSLDVINDGYMYFDKIISAEPIEFSDYEVPDSLIDKIEKNIDDLRWLDYDLYDNNVLNYYRECSILDNDPYQHEHFLVPGIDVSQLRKEKHFILDDEQKKFIIEKIYRYDIKNNDNKRFDLAISSVAIEIKGKKYIICYYDVLFDPYNGWLKLKPELKFNKSFMIDGRRYSLFNYVNMDVEEFIQDFQKDYHKKREIIMSNLKKNEKYDELPELFVLERDFTVDLSETFEEIENNYRNNELKTPLKSFFGNITKRNNIRRKEPNIVIYDERVNINQMRVIYNALKYPVTYVQGPPGTGKTQTILNVILSAFFEGKTMLVCSGNNKPVDGIIGNLNFKYKNEEVLLPFLRLGKFEDVIAATNKIRKLYEYESKETVKEHLINRIVIHNKHNHIELLKMLEVQEKRVLFEDYIINTNRLLESFKNQGNTIAKHLKNKIDQFKQELETLPVVGNEELVDLFVPIKKSKELQQFLYYKSLSYINKLKEPKYKELIDICYIEDDENRALEFNKWLQSDDNMRILNFVFPIIFSTNISSHRLGTPAYKFDLVIMDEAGQCNVAHALIPIVRAENLLLVGDPNQLKPVILIEDHINEKLKDKFGVSELYDYKAFSILDVMRKHDNISKYILIKYHYRCGKKIIKFSNDRYYQSALDLSYLKSDGDVAFLNVKTSNVFEKNTSYEEAIEIVKYIKRHNLKDVAIITPFVNQETLLKKLLIDNGLESIPCGTIHSVQGAEKDVIILSTALSYKTSRSTYNWIKNNFELLNVGSTRAKNKLIISGDMDSIKRLSDKNDDLYNLVKYAMSNGTITVPPNDNIKIEIGKSNGSKNEDLFFNTISHFCSTHKNFEVKRNVEFSKIFSDDPVLARSKKEFDIVLYEIRWPSYKVIPMIAIEINGGEHFRNKISEIRDIEKMNACKKHNIQLIIIDNSFVKSYEYIRDLLIVTKNKKATQLSIEDMINSD